MVKQIDARLKDLLVKYGEDATAVWDCHGTWVALHAAVERMAAKASIKFDKPEMIVNDPEKKTVVVCVGASMGDRFEWSFGEVSPSNNKNAYPYAMAEKRAKDRAALKLLGMAGLVYSEEEADDFKDARPAPEPEPTMITKSSSHLKKAGSWEALQSDLAQDMVDARSLVAFEAVRQSYRDRAKEEGWSAAWKAALKDEFEFYHAQIVKATQSVEDDIITQFPGARVVSDREVMHSALAAGE